MDVDVFNVNEATIHVPFTCGYLKIVGRTLFVCVLVECLFLFKLLADKDKKIHLRHFVNGK